MRNARRFDIMGISHRFTQEEKDDKSRATKNSH